MHVCRYFVQIAENGKINVLLALFALQQHVQEMQRLYALRVPQAPDGGFTDVAILPARSKRNVGKSEAKGLRMGYLSSEFRKALDTAYAGILRQFVAEGENGVPVSGARAKRRASG